MKIYNRTALGIICALTVTTIGTSNLVRAESLRASLAAAYRTNPQLDAERARLRATDEEVARAHSGYRPTITGSADVGRLRTKSTPSSPANGTTTSRGYALNVIQPLFRGLRTVNAVAGSEASVRAARASLRTIEQSVLLSAVQVYSDVVRDQKIITLRRRNVAFLTEQLRATRKRLSVGEVTKTDLAQSQARRAGAVAAMDLARANLRTSAAEFERVIGHPPRRLKSPPPHSKLLPKTLRDAIALANNESPEVIRALYLERAANKQVDTIRGELAPTAQLEANYSHRYDPSRLTSQNESASITGRLNVPFYQAGEVSARVRQAKHTHVSRLQEIRQARAQAQSTAIAAWSQLLAARAALISDQAQVRANRTALKGVRAEEAVGQRTLLDVLNAEQELLVAQVLLASDKRNLVVASYSLLSSVGRLSALDLSLSNEVYDPDVHYHEVRRKPWGIRITHADGRFETYTAPYK